MTQVDTISPAEWLRVGLLAAFAIVVWAYSVYRVWRSAREKRRSKKEWKLFPDNCEFSGNCDQQCEKCCYGGLSEGY